MKCSSLEKNCNYVIVEIVKKKIGLHVSLASNLAGRIPLQFYQRFLVLQFGGLVFLKHEIYNKQISTC